MDLRLNVERQLDISNCLLEILCIDDDHFIQVQLDSLDKRNNPSVWRE